MAKVNRVRRLKYRCRNDKAERVRRPSHSHKIFKNAKKTITLSEKKDWEDATCSVCMEAPHNAVLLLCSSYNKGCRPYMCATSYRFSNCLDQYKNAYKKAASLPNSPSHNSSLSSEKTQVCELLCPLCRGQVKGWTLVEPARKYLNKKKRTCMEEKCSFVGNYKQLKKHVKADHPWARPREVDPSLEEKWKSLENERALDDVISTLPPGSVVLGDYVIDPNTNPFFNFNMDMDDLLGDDIDLFETNPLRSGAFQFLRATGRGNNNYDDDDDDDDDDGEEDVDIRAHPFRHSRGRMLFFGRSRRRRRRN
ncbi:hypothetical protein RND81_03G234000 [Saponaria officinalis]|uniref:Uncharacterized protein n=1 Tax=Saponaria officinalis TaxID=3572 RepID=A0AAW1M2H4_SAPOF